MAKNEWKRNFLNTGVKNYYENLPDLETVKEIRLNWKTRGL